MSTPMYNARFRQKYLPHNKAQKTVILFYINKTISNDSVSFAAFLILDIWISRADLVKDEILEIW